MSGGVGCDSGRSPDRIGNRDNLLWLTRKVVTGMQAVAAEGGGFDNLAIDDLVRKTNLKNG